MPTSYDPPERFCFDRIFVSAGARLCAVPKGEVSGVSPLAPEEDRLLRAAFGRYGGRMAARIAAAPVVRRYQQLGAGSWFLCPCRPGAERPPALVPVAQTHIRRHQDARWPAHAEECDFHREPEEQRVITLSYSPAAAVRPLRLARPLSDLSFPLHRRFVANSYATKHPGLARLLMRLVIGAGFQRIDPGWRPPPLVDQVKAIWGGGATG